MNVRNALLLTLLLATASAPLAAQGPTIVEVRRDKGFPNAADQVMVTFVARSNGSPLDPATARVCYDASFDDVMTGSDCLMATALNDSTFTATIPAQTSDTYVRYWASITDNNSQTTLLPADTNHYKFFYKIFTAPPTIYDVQYTPNVGGTGGYSGFDVTFTAVVTADTGDIPFSNAPLGPGRFMTIQQGENSPWNGIVLVVRDSNGNIIPGLAALRRGDSITVTGRLNENNDMTVMENATVVANYGPAILPTPFYLSTEVVGRKKEGETIDPERWEGVLVEYRNAVVTDVRINNFGDRKLIVVDAGREDDSTNYTPVLFAARLASVQPVFKAGDRFQFIRGIVIYNGSNYELIPRDSNDYDRIPALGVAEENRSPVSINLSLAPTPASGPATLQLILPRSMKGAMQIVDMLGRPVMDVPAPALLSAGVSRLPIDVGTLVPGAYFLRLDAAGESTTLPIVVAR